MIRNFIKQHNLDDKFVKTARQYFQPLADNLVRLRSKKRQEQSESNNQPYFIGLNGCQGSGKSTLADFLQMYLLRKYQLSAAVLSLDDFYLATKEREQLAKTLHPLFRTRGVPGTHKIDLLGQTLKSLASINLPKQVVKLPRFNKALDEPVSQALWPKVSAQLDFVIVEGWFWGVPIQQEGELAVAVNALEKNQDKQGTWRKAVNDFLENYQHLYLYMDYWLMLKAPNFDCVYQWRLEQEMKLHERYLQNNLREKNAIMSAEKVRVFIEYFQRLTESSLAYMPSFSDKVFYLNPQREIISDKEN